MAQAIKKDSKLQMVFETGLNGQGKPVLKSKTYSNIKQSATADQLFSVGQAIAGLSKYPLTEINRNDSYFILG